MKSLIRMTMVFILTTAFSFSVGCDLISGLSSKEKSFLKNDGEEAPLFDPIDPNLLSPPETQGTTGQFLIDRTKLPTAQIRFTPEGEGDIRSIAFTPDSRFLISVSYGDFTIRLWNAEDSSEVDSVKMNYRPTGMDISPDGKMFVITDAYGHVTLWSLDRDRIGSPEGIGVIGPHPAVSFSPTGNLFVTASSDNKTSEVAIWSLAEKTIIRRITTPEIIRSLAFSPSGELLAAGSRTNKLTLWDLRNGKGRTYTIPKVDKNSDVSSLAFSPDGKYLATGHMDSSITVWDVEDRKEVHNFFAPNASTSAVRFSPDGGILATANQDTIHIWDAKTAQPVGVLRGHRTNPRCIAFSPDGRMLASGNEDNSIIIWR